MANNERNHSKPSVSQTQIKLPKAIYEEIFIKELLDRSGHKNMSLFINNILFSKLSESKLIDRTPDPRKTITFDPISEKVFTFLGKKEQISFKPRISKRWIIPLFEEKVGYGKVPELLTKVLIEWMLKHGYIYKEKLDKMYTSEEDKKWINDIFPEQK